MFELAVKRWNRLKTVSYSPFVLFGFGTYFTRLGTDTELISKELTVKELSLQPWATVCSIEEWQSRALKAISRSPVLR